MLFSEYFLNLLFNNLNDLAFCHSRTIITPPPNSFSAKFPISLARTFRFFFFFFLPEKPLRLACYHSTLEFPPLPRWAKWFIGCQFVKFPLGLSACKTARMDTYFIAFPVQIELPLTIYHYRARVDAVPVSDPESPPQGCLYRESCWIAVVFRVRRLPLLSLWFCRLFFTCVYLCMYVFLYYICTYKHLVYNLLLRVMKRDRDRERGKFLQPSFFTILPLTPTNHCCLLFRSPFRLSL